MVEQDLSAPNEKIKILKKLKELEEDKLESIKKKLLKELEKINKKKKKLEKEIDSEIKESIEELIAIQSNKDELIPEFKTYEFIKQSIESNNQEDLKKGYYEVKKFISNLDYNGLNELFKINSLLSSDDQNNNYVKRMRFLIDSVRKTYLEYTNNKNI